MTAMQVVGHDDEDGQELAYDPNMMSDLDELAKDIEEEVAQPTKLRHPGRPEYVLIFRSHIDSAEAQHCQKQSAKMPNPIRMQNALLLARTNTGIERNGAMVENGRGEPVTFRDPELLESLKVKTAAEAVVKFLGRNDGWILALSDTVMKAAGYGTEVEVATDPTDLA